MNLSGFRTEVAQWLLKVKFKNPLAFLAIQAVLYVYSFVIADSALIAELLDWVGLDGQNMPVLIARLIDGSKYVTGLLLGIISSSTFADLPADHPDKKNVLEGDPVNL